MKLIYKDLLVVGTKHRQDACGALMDYIEAEMDIGIDLIFDTKNPHDKNAVKVMAYIMRRSLFGKKKSSGQIGFIPKSAAKNMASFHKNKGASYSAKLVDAKYVGKPYFYSITIDVFSDFET